MSRSSWTPTYYAAIVSLGGLLFGFDASVISGVVGFVTEEFGLTPWRQGLVVSAPTLAAIAAALTIGPLADRFGRKPILIVLALLYLLSALFSALAVDFWTLVAARALGGLAFGSLVVAPLYIAEIAPASRRGTLVSINQLNIMLGFSAAYFANYLLLGFSTSGSPLAVSLGVDQHAWNWMLGLGVAPAAIFALLLAAVPESPRWLVINGREDEARKVLTRLAEPGEIEPLIAEISASLERAKADASSHLGELLHPRLRAILFVGLIVALAQQVTGINAIYFYAPTIFEQSGVGRDAAFAQAVWIGVINVIFTVIAMAAIDRVGRKPLLIVGLLGVMVSMCVAAWGFQVGRPGLVLGGILGFVAAFALSLGPVMWVLLSEIFPNRIRGLAISFVSFFNSLASFVVQFLFPWELATIGAPATFLIYAALALAGVILIAWLLPETKGRTLETLEVEVTASGG